MELNEQPTSSEANAIRFILDGKVITLPDVAPTRTVLEFLREDLGKTGTKEGCAEGDCGACTVVLGELDHAGVRFRAVNSCIQFLPTLDSKELITVENLKGSNGHLHPVQRAMVDCHASQCGFCTPGFVMSLFALYKSVQRPTRQEIADALAGNLCRCTGYRPIIDAAQKMYEYTESNEERHEHWMNCSFSSAASRERARGESEMIERLRAIERRDTLVIGSGREAYFAPATLASLAAIRANHPNARIIAGCTDVGLWVTKQHQDLGPIIYVGNVLELKRIETTETHLEIGAVVSLTDAHAVLADHYPDFGELLRRFASPPIRNAATIGGNVANGSPIGDTMPALIALQATLVLRNGDDTRELPLDRFYLAYQQTALQPGELVEKIRVPLLSTRQRFRTYKISKRFDQDISSVCAAFCLEIDTGARVRAARIAYGGVAAIPARAARCENALMGREWNQATVAGGMSALEQDFAPIDDMRASATYRRLVAKNLLQKFFLETSGEQVKTRVLELHR